MASRASSPLLATSSRVWTRASNTLIPHQPYRRTLASNTDPQNITSPVSSPPSNTPKKPYRIRTAVLLNRSPILTRTPTPFEAAYFEYNARIARALFNPFPTDFYFKAGSILESQFMREESQREKEAFGWKRHIPPEDLNAGETRGGVKSTEVASSVLGREEREEIMPRVSEADRKGDVKSLNRKGHRNLYLLVKRGKGRDEWRLPGGARELQKGELLYEAAQRELHAECGINLDTWVVGRHPIGFMDDPLPQDLTHFAGSKTFFFKAHILAGQVSLSTDSLVDFAWLTKREIRRAVTPEYWINIRDILSDF